jgi:hypothetical protein
LSRKKINFDEKIIFFVLRGLSPLGHKIGEDLEQEE